MNNPNHGQKIAATMKVLEYPFAAEQPATTGKALLCVSSDCLSIALFVIPKPKGDARQCTSATSYINAKHANRVAYLSYLRYLSNSHFRVNGMKWRRALHIQVARYWPGVEQFSYANLCIAR